MCARVRVIALLWKHSCNIMYYLRIRSIAIAHIKSVVEIMNVEKVKAKNITYVILFALYNVAYVRACNSEYSSCEYEFKLSFIMLVRHVVCFVDEICH